MAEKAARVLVVDDESQMVSIVSFALETQGFETVTARSAEHAWQIVTTSKVDLLVLDVMLPGASGVQLCERIRANYDIPVILLTARSEEEDRLKGLLAGADDYITKPFSPRELALRAAAVLRRTRPSAPTDQLVNGPLVIDMVARCATWDGAVLKISDVEWRFLAVLARYVGETVTVRTLLNEVWHTAEVVGGRDMIKTTVYRLRQHCPGGEEMVRTVRGVGYMMPRWAGDDGAQA